MKIDLQLPKSTVVDFVGVKPPSKKSCVFIRNYNLGVRITSINKIIKN